VNRILRAVTALAAAYLVTLIVCYLFGACGIRRHHLESAAFIFIAAALLRLCVSWPHLEAPAAADTARRYGPVLAIGAAALFSSAITVGWLSDDYVLRSWVLEGRFRWAGAQFVRPVALALWHLVFRAGGGAVTLHLLNIALHAANTVLAARLAARVGLSTAGAIVAAAVFFVWPTQVEPVVWAAGIFDVLGTTWMLLALVLYLRESPWLPRALDVIPICGLMALALFTKESAVALPPLALVAAAPRCRRTPGSSRQIRLVVWMTIASAAYLLWRLAADLPIAGTSTFSRYVVKEQLSRTFGTLAVPFAEPVIQGFPVLALLVTSGVVVFGAMAILQDRLSRSHVVAAQGLVWAMVAAAPAMGFLFIGPYLDGSRYLYLAALGWGWVLGGIFDAVSSRRGTHRAAAAFLAVLFAAAAFQQQRLLSDWRGAAEARDRILAEAVRFAEVTQCGAASVSGLPRTFKGAQLFNNGFAEAFEEVRASPATVRPCRWAWTGSAFKKD
jgi:hypothetical protein